MFPEIFIIKMQIKWHKGEKHTIKLWKESFLMKFFRHSGSKNKIARKIESFIESSVEFSEIQVNGSLSHKIS